jgi:hypothetical protein
MYIYREIKVLFSCFPVDTIGNFHFPYENAAAGDFARKRGVCLNSAT